MANTEWKTTTPDWWVSHGLAAYLNHMPITLSSSNIHNRQHRHRPFKFEAMSTKSDDCKHVISHAWAMDECTAELLGVMHNSSYAVINFNHGTNSPLAQFEGIYKKHSNIYTSWLYGTPSASKQKTSHKLEWMYNCSWNGRRSSREEGQKSPNLSRGTKILDISTLRLPTKEEKHHWQAQGTRKYLENLG